MQPASPSSAPQTPRKPSRRWFLRGVLWLLVLSGLFALTRLTPLNLRIRETLRGSFLFLSPSLAQQSTPTVMLLTENIQPTPSPLATQEVSPTERLPLATPSATVAVSTMLTDSTALTGGWLVLSLLDREVYHLFAYHVTTQKWLRLTDGKGDDIYPAVSPDGKWIAFASNRQGYWDLYLLSLQDGNLTPLTRTPQYDGAPTWSPDGKWLAYESYMIDPQTQQGNLEILIQEVSLAADQKPQIVQLTSASGADFAPQWSPKGRQIAFISQRARENDLWIADLDRIDDRYRNLSADLASPVQSLSWSANGDWLLWNAAEEGVQWIYRWDVNSPYSPSRKILPGCYPVLSEDGKQLFSVLSTPHHSYLQAFSLEAGTYQIPLMLLPSKPKGMSWLPREFGAHLSATFQPLSQLEELFPIQMAEDQKAAPTPMRKRLKSLENVQAPFPYLQEEVSEAFQALRAAVEQRAGWDVLSRLENAYLPLSSPAFPFSNEEWLYTGRAIALDAAVLNAGWLMVVREDYGSEIYWRLYLKTRYQDGRQGMPLRDLPFDLNARYRGDPIAYDRGGAWMSAAPEGYWIDLTELAQRYGWKRLPALATWRIALSTARYAILVKRDQTDWYAAMLELYPAEALYTPTPVPSPTQTPTRTLIPTRTATPTPTSLPTLTPRITLTPAQSLIPSVTP